MINNKKVGEAIVLLRKKQGLTQQELANKLNVSDKAISKWERGLGLPDISLLSTLAMILDTDVESLLEGNATYNKKENWVGLLDLNDNSVDIKTMLENKSILEYQIGYFMLAGIVEIYVLSNKNLDSFINKIVKDINISVKCIDNIKCVPITNIMYINSTLFIYGQSLSRSFQKAMERKNGITILSMPEYISYNINVIYDSNHKVVDDVENSIETAYRYNALPIIFYPVDYYSYINNELLKNKLVYYVNNNILYTEPMFRGIICIIMNNKDDINDSADIVRIVQKRDYEIGNLKEIELRRGLK